MRDEDSLPSIEEYASLLARLVSVTKANALSGAQADAFARADDHYTALFRSHHDPTLAARFARAYAHARAELRPPLESIDVTPPRPKTSSPPGAVVAPSPTPAALPPPPPPLYTTQSLDASFMPATDLPFSSEAAPRPPEDIALGTVLSTGTQILAGEPPPGPPMPFSIHAPDASGFSIVSYARLCAELVKWPDREATLSRYRLTAERLPPLEHHWMKRREREPDLLAHFHRAYAVHLAELGDVATQAGAVPAPLPRPLPPPPPLVTIGQRLAPAQLAPIDAPLTPQPTEPLIWTSFPEPPPLIGPLGAFAPLPPAIAAAPTPPLQTPDSSPSSAEPSTQPAPAAALPLDAYPLERCAAIAASIAHRKDDAAEILAKHELEHDTWVALDRHWLDVIQKAASGGKGDLLLAYDTAYVAQLEEERGPITIEEYAKLSLAAERGTEQAALEELDLPRGTMIRLKRIWLKRIVEQPSLGKQLREALEGAEGR